ncbi:hypothetical protein Taro_031536 [Colocasia esculenta]|uniref:Uncharacterized protein n=1 Tax=Colocasia esculenta TaxID=4460 RepID=A0A843VWX4_COLES|nr:hypothetical protein [Colocasia esculenta]
MSVEGVLWTAGELESRTLVAEGKTPFQVFWPVGGGADGRILGGSRGRLPSRLATPSKTNPISLDIADLISSDIADLISSDIADLMTNRLIRVRSGDRNKRHTSAKHASDEIHRLGRLNSLFGEKRLNGHLGLSQLILSTGAGRLFYPRLGHSARLATDKSVGVSPHRGLSTGFAGQVRSGARNKRHTSAKRASDGIHQLSRLGSLFGKKRLNSHLGLSRLMLLLL